MKPFHLLVILCLSLPRWADAQIYKRVDAEGHVTYSSEPLKGSQKLKLKPLPTMSGGKPSEGRATPEDFPRVDNQTQRRRDEKRRIILQDELASEEKLLETARTHLHDLESQPVPLVSPDGIPFRDAGAHAEKIKSAQTLVEQHEQNIRALRTEINHLK